MKLISLNVEGSKHLATVLPFLKSEQADCICLQEVFERDFLFLRKELGLHGVFAAMSKTKDNANGETDEVPLPYGIGILMRAPMEKHDCCYYYGDGAAIPLHETKNTLTDNKVLLRVDFLNDSRYYAVGTTHFTWTPDGGVSEQQRIDLQSLFLVLDVMPEIILCGDFNAPRGGEIFTALARRYKDNIPAHYTTSIDGDMHRNGHLEKMVDGLFTTPAYRAERVELKTGVSDHCAIVAHIQSVS